MKLTRNIWVVIAFFIVLIFETCSNKKGDEKERTQDLAEIYVLTDSTSSLMDEQKYDTALRLIGKTYGNLHLYKYPIHKYALLCYESEIMYYNALFNLGADKAKEALLVARSLPENDIYLGNAYNLLGINAEQVMPAYQALEYYMKALKSMPDHQNNEYSKLAHISSNLGQLELREGMLDSARKHLNKANVYAIRDQMHRTAAINYASLAQLEIRLGNLIQSSSMLDSCRYFADLSGNKDLELFYLESRMELEAARSQKSDFLKLLEQGNEYISEDPTLPNMSVLDFYQSAQIYLKQLGLHDLANKIRKQEASLFSQIKNIEGRIQDTLLQQFHINSLLLDLQDKTKIRDEQIIARNKDLIQLLWVGLIFLTTITVGVIAFVYQKRRSDRLFYEKRTSELKWQHDLAETNARFEAVLNERQRISQEFHDGVAPGLSSLKLISLALGRKNPEDNMLKNLPGIIDHTMHEIKSLLNDINPIPLFENGLHYAVNQYLNHMSQAYPAGQLKLESDIYGKRLPDDTELHLYRIIQESVHNALRHTRAEEILVTMRGDDSELFVSIKDKGVQLSDEFPADGTGNGLKNLKARALIIRADLKILHHLNGTEVQIMINLPAWQKLTSV